MCTYVHCTYVHKTYTCVNRYAYVHTYIIYTYTYIHVYMYIVYIIYMIFHIIYACARYYIVCIWGYVYGGHTRALFCKSAGRGSVARCCLAQLQGNPGRWPWHKPPQPIWLGWLVWCEAWSTTTPPPSPSPSPSPPPIHSLTKLT